MDEKELMQKVFEKLVSIETKIDKKVDEVKNSIIETRAEVLKEVALLEDKMNVRFNELERNMYRLERLEKRQDKTSVRLETLEADVSILQEKLAD